MGVHPRIERRDVEPMARTHRASPSESLLPVLAHGLILSCAASSPTQWGVGPGLSPLLCFRCAPDLSKIAVSKTQEIAHPER